MTVGKPAEEQLTALMSAFGPRERLVLARVLHGCAECIADAVRTDQAEARWWCEEGDVYFRCIKIMLEQVGLEVTPYIESINSSDGSDMPELYSGLWIKAERITEGDILSAVTSHLSLDDPATPV